MTASDGRNSGKSSFDLATRSTGTVGEELAETISSVDGGETTYPEALRAAIERAHAFETELARTMIGWACSPAGLKPKFSQSHCDHLRSVIERWNQEYPPQNSSWEEMRDQVEELRKQLGKPAYVKFTENNDHEGESWRFWIPLEGNEDTLKRLSSVLNAVDDERGFDAPQYEIDLTPVPMSEVDTLVKYAGYGGYLPCDTKLSGRLMLTDEDLGKIELGDGDDPLYKGGIKDRMVLS